MRLIFLLGLGSAILAACAPRASAQPLSKKTDIDFFRDVPSRNLKGFATRADGRLVAGPGLTDLTGTAPADLLWCLTPGASANQWLVGTGPDGKIVELTIDAAKASYASREVAKLTDSHVFSLLRLADGAVLAGTSPKGALCLVRDGKLIARVALPVDSIFDLLPTEPGIVLAATGNPGRIYRVELAKFAQAGVLPEKVTDNKALAAHGLTLFGEVRDRNIRRLAALAGGQIVAGSAPKGNIYSFARAGGAPLILQENRDGEVTDLLAEPNGDLYASITFSGTPEEVRLTPAAKPVAKENADEAPSPMLDPLPQKFSGRATLVRFPASGFPETLTARNNAAFYALAQHDGVVLVAGGEQGELLGYDLPQRLALTYAGSDSSQLNALLPIPGQPGRFIVLRNNSPGLALLDFAPAGPRSVETRKVDLGVPAQLGALRFERLRNVPTGQLSLELRTSNGSDDVEGWSPWTPLYPDLGAWKADGLQGRYVKLRIRLPANTPATAQLDKANLFQLPQNRRPQMQEFRVLAPNNGLIPAAAPVPSAVTSLSQLMQAAGRDDDKRKTAFLSSQVVPSPGAQVVLWNVTDPDGDNVECTFSIRHEGETVWTDIAVATHNSYAQFDTSHLPDGVYFTRLIATETAPRAAAERLSTTFEADDLVVDHTPPEILEATANRVGDKVVIRVHGRDALSLLDSVDANFNNGAEEQVAQPVDGILDSREETFVLEVPLAEAAGATSVEVTLYDAAGNAATRRLPLTP